MCRLFLAPSTLPQAGWAVFSAVDILRGEQVGRPELMIPTVKRRHTHKTKQTTPTKCRLDDYLWGQDTFPDLKFEVSSSSFFWPSEDVDKLQYEDRKAVAFVPGLGAAVNSHPAYVNIAHDASSRVAMDSARLNRSDVDSSSHHNEGLGGFTLYHNVTFVALHDIAAGSELFLDYGRWWFVQRNMSDLYDEMEHTKWIYERASFIITRFATFLNAVEEIHQKQGKQNDAYNGHNSTAPPIVDTIQLWKYFQDSEENHAVRTLLPPTMEELQHLVLSNPDINLAMMHSPRRPLSWLHKNKDGCIDNIDIQPWPISTSSASNTAQQDETGRGAYAARAFERGDVVSPVPLIPLKDCYFLSPRQEMKAVETSHKPKSKYDPDGLFPPHVAQDHLLLNYIYLIHGQNDHFHLLFLPYAPGVNAINHCNSSEECNVKLQWRSSSFKEHSLETHSSQQYMMDLVALRDIAVGEELTMDYGRVWDEAWKDHVQKRGERRCAGGNEADGTSCCGSPKDADWYISAKQVKEQWDRGEMQELVVTQELQREHENLSLGLPPNVRMACFYAPGLMHSWSQRTTKNSTTTIRTIPWSETLSKQTEKQLCPCKLLSKTTKHVNQNNSSNMQWLFTVQLQRFWWSENPRERFDRSHACFSPTNERHVVSGMPPSQVTFVDVPYTRSTYAKDAFRHLVNVSP